MNNKILVPTDFSTASKGGIRFAIQLASQRKSSLVFYHCAELLKPTRWSEGRYKLYVANELEIRLTQLKRFVTSVYEQMGITPYKPQYIVERGADPRKAITKYAVKIKAGFICMATRGGGQLKKLIGTNTSAITTSSSVPVFVVPPQYRAKSMSNILYASDFNELGKELKKVSAFAESVTAPILVYHYDYLLDVKETKQKLEKTALKFKRTGLKFVFQKLNLEQPLASQLKKDFRKANASLGVLFTNQKRGWFDRFFLPSKSAELAVNPGIPLLIFPKQ